MGQPVPEGQMPAGPRSATPSRPAPAKPVPRLIGLVADDPRAWAEARGAERVDFAAPRGPRLSPRRWLETVAAMDGRADTEAKAIVEAVMERAGLAAGAPSTIGALHPMQRAALAIAEVAVAVSRDPKAACVVVPQPPVPWPFRNDVRRLAATLLEGAEVVLHAYVAWELLPLMDADFVVDGSGSSIGPPAGTRTILARVYGQGPPYEAWLAALEASGVIVAGGPIAHVLAAPEGVGPREVLAAAHDAGLDVLEVRDAFDAV